MCSVTLACTPATLEVAPWFNAGAALGCARATTTDPRARAAVGARVIPWALGSRDPLQEEAA